MSQVFDIDATAHFALPLQRNYFLPQLCCFCHPVLTIPHENAETPAISKTWGIGLAIVTMIVWWMKLQLLGFCWSIGYPELVSILTFRKLIPNSTYHCHPAQVRTSQHITQPNYRIICFEAINNSIKNNALEPFPCGLNALVQGLRSWKILFFLVQLEGVETWRLENMGEADGCEKDVSMRRWQLMAFNHSGDFRM